MHATGLRDRKKERTRDELIAVALHLFSTGGFDGTTVEQIAAAAEVSPRTFFRYFATKEDALFGEQIGAVEQRWASIIAELRARPSGRTPGSVLCAALLTHAASYHSDLRTLLIRKQVIADTPALRTRALERRRSWEATITDELSAQFPEWQSPLELRVTVAAITAALYTAVDLWLDTGGLADITDLIGKAFGHLSTGLQIEPS